MGTKYPGISVTGYNSGPPSDDGTQSEANKVKWSTIKSKLSDAVKTALESMNTALEAALNYAANTQATDYTTVAADHDKIIQATASLTITALAAATAGAGYRFGVSNQHTAAITVSRSGSDTFNGAATSFKVPPGVTIWFYVNAATNGYLVYSPVSSLVTVTTGNGTGSTNTAVRRFTTTETNTGSAITYADSATLGATFTINEPGLYAITYTDYHTSNASIGISLNSAELTTAPQSISAGTRISLVSIIAGFIAQCSTVKRLAVNDVIRAHCDGTLNRTDTFIRFSIEKVGM